MSEEKSINAYGKINLGLDVLGILPNGYHEVCMIMQTVDLHDTIVIRKSRQSGITIKADRPGVPCDERNLAYKAAALIMKQNKITVDIEISIEKRIPIAAGMAGGSTDCAAVLKGINELYQLGLGLPALQKMGAELGADVPYCLLGGTALAEGIGEILTPLSQPPFCYILLAKPEKGISTKYVYQNLKVDQVDHPDIKGMTEDLKNQDLKALCSKMGNVLESVTASELTEINELKKLMKNYGAMQSLMSGSGPTVFGLFEKETDAKKAGQAIHEKHLAKEVYVTVFMNPGKEQINESKFECRNG